MQNTFRKGFTLVELLIVITILAALAAAVVVVLNPAELLAQARDAQRLSDMTTMRDAVNLFITQAITRQSPNFLCFATPTGCTAGHCTFAPAAQPFGTGTPTCHVLTPVASRAINGTGWVTIDFANNMHGGSPVSALPIDPVNNGSHFYGFRAHNADNNFKLVTRLESVRHRAMMANDGGTRNGCGAAPGFPDWNTVNCFFEIGTNMAL